MVDLKGQYKKIKNQIDTAAKIGMVFRNEDGTQELKMNDSGCKDFIFPVGIVQVILTQPTSDLVVINSGADSELVSLSSGFKK